MIIESFMLKFQGYIYWLRQNVDALKTIIQIDDKNNQKILERKTKPFSTLF